MFDRAGQSANEARIVAACREALEGFHIPDPWDLDKVLTWMEEVRGRRIKPLPRHTCGGVTGTWVASESTDYIVHEARTSEVHKSIIVIHELAHMWLGHPSHAPESIVDGEDLPHDYSPEHEYAADVFANLVMVRAALHMPTVPSDVARVMQTFTRGVSVGTLADHSPIRRARLLGWLVRFVKKPR